MKDTDYDQDDDVTLERLNKEWLGEMVRQREAPQGYECNIGCTFLVGEVMLAGPQARPMVRQLHGLWIPLDHVERIAVAKFEGDPDGGTTILLTAGGMNAHRIHLNRANQTVPELQAQFEAAVTWLGSAEDLKRDIAVSVAE